MNGKLLILFVILVLGLILASFLGGSLIENMENPSDASGNQVIDAVMDIPSTTTDIPVTTDTSVGAEPGVISVTDVALSD